HDFGNPLGTGLDSTVGSYIKDDCFCGDFVVDGLQNHSQPGIVGLLQKQNRRVVILDPPAFQNITQVLGKAGFTRSKEAGNPDPNSLVRLLGCLLIGLENLQVLVSD